MKDDLKLLVVGSGGREHAIAKKLLASSHVSQVYCAPGNPGMTVDGIIPVAISELDFLALKGFCYEEKIAWTFVGPENALVAGIVDSFEADGLKIFGPAKTAAQLEGSKDFAMRFMNKYAVPTAKFATFSDSASAIEGLAEFSEPVVIKADGLAAGKGVVIAQTKDQAREEIALMFKKGQKRLVLSEFLSGAEYSLFVAVGRKDYRILPMAQDHKRAFDFDKGLNTGGMGAYSPLPQLPETDYQRMLHEVVEPTIAGLRQEEFDYCGILYIGLIMTEQGPKVIEYNVRLGDPETQVVLPRITSDFAQLIDCALNGDALPAIEVTAKACLGVVVAAAGYPGEYLKGQVLPGLQATDEIKVDYANVSEKVERFVGNGGRLLCVLALEDDLQLAQAKAYSYLAQHKFVDCYYRHDIGAKATGKFAGVTGKLEKLS